MAARGLGKGLDALIPNAVGESTKAKKSSQKEAIEEKADTLVKITMVEPNREQPRKNFDEDALLELSESIKQFGLLQPILVQDRKDHYEIIAGERRWRAAKLAGLKEVPVIIKNLTEQEIVEIKEENGEYPAGMCGDIRINFVHYDSFEEGVCKWEERKQRINWNNLFIVGTERDGCTYETLKRFEQLPYTNKVIFTHIEYPEFSSAYYIKGFEDQGEIGTVTNWRKQFLKRRYMDDFDYVSFLNGDC